jgi:hypothetical protein
MIHNTSTINLKLLFYEYVDPVKAVYSYYWYVKYLAWLAVWSPRYITETFLYRTIK